MPGAALPSALSCLYKGVDVTFAIWPTPTPGCSGASGVSPRGWLGTAASAWVRQPGSLQAPWQQNEVSQKVDPEGAAADQSLVLSFLRASQALPRGQKLGKDPEGVVVGAGAGTTQERGPASLQ